MYDQAFSFLDFGYGSAISFLLTGGRAGARRAAVRGHPAPRAGDVHVIVGDRRQRIAGMGTRYAILDRRRGRARAAVRVHGVDLAQVAVVVLEFPPKLIPDHPTTANYADAWGSQNFGRYFLNSTLVAIATTVLTVLLAAMMAYGFARFDFPGRRLLFAAVVVGLTVPTMLLIIPQFLLARDLQMLDKLYGLVPFYVGTQLAFSTFLLRAFFERLPVELDEAMTIDGAGAWRRFWSLAAAAVTPGAGHVCDLHVPRQLGRVHLGAHRHQRRRQPHAADRHRPVPRPAQHELGPDLRRVDHRHRSRDRRVPAVPTAHRVGAHERRAAWLNRGRRRCCRPAVCSTTATTWWSRCAVTSTGPLTVYHLGDVVARHEIVGRRAATVSLGPLPPGGFGVELDGRRRGGAHGGSGVGDPAPVPALRVRRRLPPRPRHRRGGRARPAAPPDRGAVLRLGLPPRRSARRWRTLRRPARQRRLAGDRATLWSRASVLPAVATLGYAAVYGVGARRVAALEHLALQQADGTPYTLGEFLSLVDPAAPEWLDHFVDDLARAVGVGRVRRLPPRPVRLPAPGGAARRHTGRRCRRRSSASSKPHVPGCQRAASSSTTSTTSRPGAPPRSPRTPCTSRRGRRTSRSARSPRWSTRARTLAGDRPVVVAAYQHVYRETTPGRAPTSPRRSRWPRCSRTAPPTCSPARTDGCSSTPTTSTTTSPRARRRTCCVRWYDFLVEHDELLMDPALVDVTGAWAGPYNDVLDVTYGGVDVADEPRPGCVWRRVVAVPGENAGLVVHLVNLVGQDDTVWDAPRRPVGCNRRRDVADPARRSGAAPRSAWPTRTGPAGWSTCRCGPRAPSPPPSCRRRTCGRSCYRRSLDARREPGAAASASAGTP